MVDRYHISVILTDECNMRCRYCTTAKRPVDISEHVLDRLAALLEDTAPASLDVNFHGGEPTLVWESVIGLNERLAALSGGRRISRNMCTNGTRMNAERAQYLAAHQFNVRVSIDGRRDSHTLYRFPKGGRKAEATLECYGQTTDGLQHLIDAGVRTAANMVVTPPTVHELARNAAYLVKRGLVHLVVSPVVGMPWADEHLETLERELLVVQEFWRHWMVSRDRRETEDLRRSILSEIERADYCIGGPMNQPDARVFVIGPDGRIFGDEPEARTEDTLVLGHVDSVTSFAELPRLERTAFQLMYDREFYEPHVLEDVRRTHEVLKKRMTRMYRALFGPLPERGVWPGASTSLAS
jgi:sulfatase maturation enzyme AslB (radical SAM superfamily)